MSLDNVVTLIKIAEGKLVRQDNLISSETDYAKRVLIETLFENVNPVSKDEIAKLVDKIISLSTLSEIETFNIAIRNAVEALTLQIESRLNQKD